MKKEDSGELKGELARDLRQIYSDEIVGEHLKDVARARKANHYPNYYKCLHDLFIVVFHKFKKKEKARTEYEDLRKEIVNKANKHSSVWLGTNNDSEACNDIEESLNKLEMFLYSQMEEGKMFGSRWEDDGL